MGLRLGAPTCGPHQCRHCSVEVDVFGRHSLSCKKSEGRHFRHSALNDIVKRGLSAAHIPSGCLLVWDATCPDTFAISYRAQATSEAGRVAESAEDRKAEKYRGLPASHSFTPVAIETLGAIGPRSMLFLRDIGLPWSLVSHGPTISCSNCQWRCRGGTQPQCGVA